MLVSPKHGNLVAASHLFQKLGLIGMVLRPTGPVFEYAKKSCLSVTSS